MRTLHPGFLAVRFRDDISHADRRRVVEACHLGRWPQRLELPGESFTLLPVAEGREDARARHARSLRALGAHDHVVRTAVVHRYGHLRGVATDRIWVAMRGAARRAVEALERRGAHCLETGGAGEFLYRLPPHMDPWRICARLRVLRTVSWAEPDHVLVGRRFAAGRLRTAGPVQPALRRIGAPEAWRLQPGVKDVLIAVLDDGILASHPDLKDAIAVSFDATGRGTPTRPSPWDSHGTECAALVAGAGRTRGSVKGVAAGCRLAAVRIGYTPTRLADYVTKASWLRRGIDWAWQHDAGVLSMSFGGGPPLRAVTAALRRARTQGRGGKGCVLVAAAGNDGTRGVEYPAAVAGVVAVGATEPTGRPASFSNRGAVTIAAPGVNIATATIPDPAEGETSRYTTDSGTSLATPLVAGAAAMLLCAMPSLTEAAVRQRLTATAERVRGLRFTDGHNDQVGAGVLNVARALKGVA